VLNQAQQLVRAFQEGASRLTDGLHAADMRARQTVSEINALASQIAALNRAYGSTGPAQQSLHLQDQQAALVRRLSELVDVDVLERAQGGLDITFGQGRALVIGEEAYAIAATSTPPSGLAQMLAGGRNVTAEIVGGRLGGVLAARDGAIPDYMNRLDEIAFEVVSQVNTLHAAGFDQLGVAGGDFFAFSTPPTGVTGAARAMRVDTAVAGDARLIAAASVALAGDNGNARAIANLRDAQVLSSNTATLIEGWSQLVYRVGRDVRLARDERDSRGEIVRQVEALRDAVSGVSLDEEAASLMKFQRAYEANAKYFTVIDETLATLLSLVR
jgi:flagellar hook-associated protein 1 FlgK